MWAQRWLAEFRDDPNDNYMVFLFADHTTQPLLDHLVGYGEQTRRDRDAERVGGLAVDDQFEFGRLSYLKTKITHQRPIVGQTRVS